MIFIIKFDGRKRLREKWSLQKMKNLLQRTYCYWLTRFIDFQIRLQIKRTVPRQVTELSFHDRNVDDAPDGYVSCDSYKDNREWRHVEKMERGMQGVPILVWIVIKKHSFSKFILLFVGGFGAILDELEVSVAICFSFFLLLCFKVTNGFWLCFLCCFWWWWSKDCCIIIT